MEETPFFSRQERFAVVGSTNDVVRGWLESGTAEVCLAVADEQSAGRGRAGRTWLAPKGAALLLTGWTDYAFSSDNVAASQAGHALTPPALQVKDAAGRWTTVLAEIGVPVGRPQTIVVDLTDRFLSSSREVRIQTSMRVY